MILTIKTDKKTIATSLKSLKIKINENNLSAIIDDIDEGIILNIVGITDEDLLKYFDAHREQLIED